MKKFIPNNGENNMNKKRFKKVDDGKKRFHKQEAKNKNFRAKLY